MRLGGDPLAGGQAEPVTFTPEGEHPHWCAVRLDLVVEALHQLNWLEIFGAVEDQGWRFDAPSVVERRIAHILGPFTLRPAAFKIGVERRPDELEVVDHFDERTLGVGRRVKFGVTRNTLRGEVATVRAAGDPDFAVLRPPAPDHLVDDLRHLVNTVHGLTQGGVGFKVLTGHGASIDTATPAGKLVFGIFAALAEFERDLVTERTLAGLASARARGRNGGAPFKMTAAKVRLAMVAMGQPGTKIGELCRELGVTRQTLYRHVGPDGSVRQQGQRLLDGKRH